MNAMNTMNTQINARVVTITPEWAEELLDRNPGNRRMRPALVKQLCRTLQRGEWVLNGEAVKVDVEGRLLDGQHRLQAVLLTGIPIQTLLVEGLTKDKQDTMDTGRARSLADVLAIKGENNASKLATTVRRMMVIEQFGLKRGTNPSGSGLFDDITTVSALAWLEDNGWVRDYLAKGASLSRHMPIGAATSTCLYILLERIDPMDADEFFTRLVDGVGLETDDPIYLLRERFNKALRERRGNLKSQNQGYYSALLVKAWNAYRAGVKIKSLRYVPGGANPESFPDPA